MIEAMNQISKQMVNTLLLLCILLAHLSFPSFQENVLTPLNPKLEITLIENISIDFFGALLPIAVSFLAAFYLLFFRKFSRKRYLYGLVAAVSFGLMASSGNGAVVVRYQLFDYILAILVFFLVFQGEDLGSLSLNSIVISKQNYLNSMLIIYSLGSLAIFFVDLTYLPFVTMMQIGAAGLVDAISLSGLFSFIPLTVVVVIFDILLEEKRKMKFPLHRQKYEDLKKQIPELLVTTAFVIIFFYFIFTVLPSLNPRETMNFGAIVIILTVVFVFLYSAVKSYIESRKQKKLNQYCVCMHGFRTMLFLVVQSFKTMLSECGNH